ncbi:aspartate--tRNA ligase [bacterium]|nr:aspartate--tRNA ligase [candidate division CSSED10-310 bacterium]
MLERTHYCTEITHLEPGTTIRVAGWVRKRRDLGNLVFIDLYDRSGILQVVFDPVRNPDLVVLAQEMKRESVLTVEGTISMRPDEAVNQSMKTGRIELIASRVKLHSTSRVPPFHLIGDQEVNEELRLKYRYLDLRRSEMFRILSVRHQTYQVVRKFYSDNGFIEVTTPHLIRSTPEGARDFLVPSRLYPGRCYALPQSPQILKQILMIGGVDRYFQIVKCFRDEDSRADRQPEFSQIDVEMSFVTRDTLFRIHEELMAVVYREVLGIEIQTPFPRMTYSDALVDYGSDKPDIRFDLKLRDATDVLAGSGYQLTEDAIRNGGGVRGVVYPGGAGLSRKQIGDLERIVRSRGPGGLITFKTGDGGELTGSPLGKHLEPERRLQLVQRFDARPGDLICLAAGGFEETAWALGDLRLEIARRGNMTGDSLKFLWVIDFPLFEYVPQESRYQAMHHPFTAPLAQDENLLDSNPALCRAQAYDLVLNGVELGGGSVRIFREDLQCRIFKALGLTKQEAENRFGFFLEALRYGTPPHCGIAFGMDRLIMMLAGTDNLRDVIAFPKTLQAACLLTNAPSPATSEQMKMLGLKSLIENSGKKETT